MKKYARKLDAAAATVVTPAANDDGLLHTVCHGDFWVNNFLVSNWEEGAVGGGDAATMKLIDFGNVFYGHPAYDVAYVLSTSGDGILRSRDNLDRILHVSDNESSVKFTTHQIFFFH